MSVKQISVFLENKPGMLNQMTAELAKSGINMRALSLAETKDFGIARIIADDTLSAMNALKENGFIAALTPVLAFEIPNEAGGLNHLLQTLTDAEVNIEYMYSCLSLRGQSKAVMVFRVTDTEKSESALVSRGLYSLTQEEI
ncbi:MAG: ACT domain-containing protein [Clostridia bacterium]|nr:ACT domain-containing protein [Clostridia bacterium]